MRAAPEWARLGSVGTPQKHLNDINLYISALKLYMRPPALRQNAHIRPSLAGSSAIVVVAG
jgi:hypothetical protein